MYIYIKRLRPHKTRHFINFSHALATRKYCILKVRIHNNSQVYTSTIYRLTILVIFALVYRNQRQLRYMAWWFIKTIWYGEFCENNKISKFICCIYLFTCGLHSPVDVKRKRAGAFYCWPEQGNSSFVYWKTVERRM